MVFRISQSWVLEAMQMYLLFIISMSLDLKTIPAIGSNKKVLTSPISSPVQLRSRGLPTLQCEVVQEWTGIFQVIEI